MPIKNMDLQIEESKIINIGSSKVIVGYIKDVNFHEKD